MSQAKATGLEIAIIGMAGRFPGAENVEAFWRNLRAGVESISFFSVEELLAQGLDAAEVMDPAYVRARGVLPGLDAFDAGFFGYSPREARITDPQHRLFLECSWEALEDAGYDPLRCTLPVGVYAGAGMSNYLGLLRQSSPQMLRKTSSAQLMIGNDKDYLSTRVSYKLGLEGPSLTIQTACSTSLVAVHVAVQALLNGECDMALAGGVAVRLPEKSGYRYQEGMILSPDGRCRAFSANAQGTVGGQGLGIVVLRRLEDALEAGDSIRAVLKGTAINNDGSQKIGYTAPRVEGQARVIRAAQIQAGVDADTITYVEGHGTATPLGDPIEVAALTRAFRATTERKGFCALGSVKSNIGHLDTAAGVAGLIKTVLALQHREIPPTLHAEVTNPEIDFAGSPFYVNTELREWPAGAEVRRAGVSSFGIGGTNVHVVLEEAPLAVPGSASRPHQLLVLSARSAAALETATDALADHLDQQQPGLDLADVTYTLQVGRHGFAHRRGVVAASPEEAVAALRSRDGARLFEGRAGESAPAVAFLFPGQGAQYVGMGAELYVCEPVFRQEVDACCEILTPLLGVDPRRFLVPEEADDPGSIESTELAQPLLFVMEYALARLLGSWGVLPAAMIGHSVGEYVAACLAGVLSREQALRLVAARGRLMQQQPAGAMLAVPLAAGDLEPLLSSHGLELAAVNAPTSCVISGREEAVQALETDLEAQGVRCRRLHTSHAFHSSMMDDALEPFAAEVARVELAAPRIPFLSNLSGGWIRLEEATDPEYWVAHLRGTVHFSEGIAELLRDRRFVLLEVGPGHTLATLVRKQVDRSTERVVLSTMRHPGTPGSDVAVLLQALGRLWAAGAEVDWAGFSAHERRRRVPLPAYPFERQRYGVEPEASAESPLAQPSAISSPAPAERFHVPVWRQAPLLTVDRPAAAPDRRWLVFLDACGLGARIAERLVREGARVLTVKMGEDFARLGQSGYSLAPGQAGDYDTLLADLEGRGALPTDLIHAWSVSVSSPDLPSPERLESAQERGFWSLLFLAQALGRRNLLEPLRIAVLSNDLHRIAGEGGPAPEKATLLGPCLVLRSELSGISSQSIDVVLPPSGSWQEESLVASILDEMGAGMIDPIVAYRGNSRWLRSFAPLRLDGVGTMPLKDGGVYLITGGLGTMGLDFAELFARQARVKLALLSRSSLSGRSAALAEPQGFLAASCEEDVALIQSVEAEVAAELAPRDLDSFGDLQQRLDALCASHVLDYLMKNGGGVARGVRRSRSALREALGILPKFHRFYDYMLAILEEDGVVRCEREDLIFLHGPDGLGAPQDLHAHLASRFPEFAGLFDLLAHCAAGYAEALRGDIEGVSVLYPDGERRLLDESGRRTADYGRWQLYVTLTAELVARMVDRAPGRPLRVLEVGAGTGILTRRLISRLRSHNLEYWFTDLGRAFVLRAERETAEQGLGFLRFTTLDISQDPVHQGLAEGGFDLILGLDVVHATKNLVETTSNLRRLLAPGGTLAIVERVQSHRWTNLIWGLAEGWWYFEDARRHLTPLLSLEGWEETLREAGYTDVAGHPRNGRESSNYALITGRAPLNQGAAHRALESGDERGRERLRRVRQLEALGAEVMVCPADVSDPVALESAVAAVRSRFGRIDGVIHAAGILGAGVIQRKTREAAQAVLAPKVAGTLALERLLRDDRLDFFVLCSSTSALSGASGQVDYCAANAFLDSFAQWSSLGCGRPAVSIDWERWTGKGMAVEAARGLPAGSTVAPGRNVAHSLLQRLIHESDFRVVFAARLDSGEWALDEHRILGLPVLPGTAYLEMARAAFEEITGSGEVEIRDVMFWGPLVVPDGEHAEVYTVLDRVANGFNLQVVSSVEVEGERRFRRHATATVLPLTNGEEGNPQLDTHLLELWSEAEVEPPPPTFVESGRRWSVLRRHRSDATEALGTLRLDDEITGDLEVFKLHPGLLDVATGLSAGGRPDALYVPLSYRSLRLLAPLAREVMVRVQRQDFASPYGEVFSIDVVIADRMGRILVEVDGFTKRRVEAGQGQREALTVPAAAGSQGLLAADTFPEIMREPREHGIHPRDGVDALRRILAWNRGPQIVVVAGGQPAGAQPVAAAAASVHRAERGGADAPVLDPTETIEGPEAVLASIWSEVLGVASVGPHDNFFELGGDSILGLQVVARAREAGLHLSPAQIFERQTISELARVLAPEDKGREAPAMPAEPFAPTVPAPEAPAAAPPHGFPLVNLSDERLSRLARRLKELDGADE